MQPEQALLENFEDARFALLMDDQMRREGRRLSELNRKLQCDSAAAVPEKTFERCLMTIQTAFRARGRARSRQRWRKSLKYLPVAVLLAASLFMSAMAAFPQLRADFLNLVRTEKPQSTTWSYGEPAPLDVPLEELDSSFALAAPEGFLVEEYYRTALSEYIVFHSLQEVDHRFRLSVVIGDNASASVDNENYIEKREITVHDNPATLYIGENTVWMIWSDPSVPCIYILDADGLSAEALLEIAESITYLGPRDPMP